METNQTHYPDAPGPALLPAPGPDGRPVNGDSHHPRPPQAEHGSDAEHGSNPEHGGEEGIPTDLPKPSNLTVVLLVLVLALLLAGLFAVGYFPNRAREREARADAAEVAGGAPTVDVVRPKPTAASRDVILPGDVRPFQDTYLYTRASGFLKKWYKDIGDHVEAGEKLADIDIPDVEAQLAQSKASLEQSRTNVTKSEADLGLAETTLKRYVDAQKNNPGSVTQQDVDDKRAAYNDAVAAVAAAKSAVVASQADVDRLNVLVGNGFKTIIAPFSGTVVSRNYDNGALLSPAETGPGKELFHVAQTDTLRVFVNVPQSYADAIKSGQPAYLSVRNFPGREFEGAVARNAGAIDPSTRTLSVEVHFPNKDGQLYAGMYGQVRLKVDVRKPVLLVPSSALVFNATGSQVAVVKDNKVHFQSIVVGRDLGTELEVASGLNENDGVVSNPGERLAEGGDVKVVNTNHPEDMKPVANVATAKN